MKPTAAITTSTNSAFHNMNSMLSTNVPIIHVAGSYLRDRLSASAALHTGA